MIHLSSIQAGELIAHARRSAPRECCGLIAGTGDRAQSIYPLQNVAVDPLVGYEAAPLELFAAQKLMRERSEDLLAIYHSHPRAKEPEPSPTDVRLAYYPDAVYLIIGLGGIEPILRAFHISESEQCWHPVEYQISDE